jgi:GTP-binding protein HflX
MAPKCSRDADARLEETAGPRRGDRRRGRRKVAFRVRQPKPATLIGSGQVEQIAAAVRMEEAGSSCSTRR